MIKNTGFFSHPDFQKLLLDEGITQQRSRGDYIYHEGNRPESVYFVKSGLIGLFNTSESGHETLFRVFGDGNFLGHRSCIAEEPYHASALVLAPSTLISISTKKFIHCLKNKPELLFFTAQVLSRELKAAEMRFAHLLDKDAPARVAESIAFLKFRNPDYSWTRKEIAEYAGTTVETVARTLTQFEKEGLIEKIGRSFEILDGEKLRKQFSQPED